MGINKFLSTLPARGATGILLPPMYSVLYFYPRSPRGERHFEMVACATY